eukprot:1209316-Rhodomonas_salina.1
MCVVCARTVRVVGACVPRALRLCHLGRCRARSPPPLPPLACVVHWRACLHLTPFCVSCVSGLGSFFSPVPSENGCSDNTVEMQFITPLVKGCGGTWATGGVLGGASLCSGGWGICSLPDAQNYGVTPEECNRTGCVGPGQFYATTTSPLSCPPGSPADDDDFIGCTCSVAPGGVGIPIALTPHPLGPSLSLTQVLPLPGAVDCGHALDKPGKLFSVFPRDRRRGLVWVEGVCRWNAGAPSNVKLPQHSRHQAPAGNTPTSIPKPRLSGRVAENRLLQTRPPLLLAECGRKPEIKHIQSQGKPCTFSGEPGLLSPGCSAHQIQLSRQTTNCQAAMRCPLHTGVCGPDRRRPCACAGPQAVSDILYEYDIASSTWTELYSTHILRGIRFALPVSHEADGAARASRACRRARARACSRASQKWTTSSMCSEAPETWVSSRSRTLDPHEPAVKEPWKHAATGQASLPETAVGSLPGCVSLALYLHPSPRTRRHLASLTPPRPCACLGRSGNSSVRSFRLRPRCCHVHHLACAYHFTFPDDHYHFTLPDDHLACAYHFTLPDDDDDARRNHNARADHAGPHDLDNLCNKHAPDSPEHHTPHQAT